MDFVEIFTKIQWNSVFSSHFKNHTKKCEKKCLRHEFIQNFIRILVDTFIVNLILWAKNTNEIDPFNVFSSKNLISDGSTLMAFFTHKMSLTAKMIVSTRILMKFLINPYSKNFFWFFFVCLLKWLWSLVWKAGFSKYFSEISSKSENVYMFQMKLKSIKCL